ncbi:MAG TPA: DUF1059 domain-containing protein [Actinomycetota bacterium]|nr:DUF1059 domain-containing protein [Actinomycetota bacterium]
MKMAWAYTCECGFVVRGGSDDEFVANAQQHAKSDHNVDLTRQQALAIAEPAQDG